MPRGCPTDLASFHTTTLGRSHQHGRPSFHYESPSCPRPQQPTSAQVAITADLGRDHGRGAGVPAMLVQNDGLLAE